MDVHVLRSRGVPAPRGQVRVEGVHEIGPVLDVVLHQGRQPLVHEAPEMPFLGVAEEQRVDPELRSRGRRAVATQPQQHMECAAGAVMAGCQVVQQRDCPIGSASDRNTELAAEAVADEVGGLLCTNSG